METPVKQPNGQTKWAPIQLPVTPESGGTAAVPTQILPSPGPALKPGKTNDTHSRTMHLITASDN